MKTRREHDLLGELDIPAGAYYGIQTYRGMQNFQLTGKKLKDYPDFVKGMAVVKQGAALANHELGLLDEKICQAIVKACEEIRAGEYLDEFPVDMIQGGAGTSTNMNANEVIANRALEILGHKKGEYDFCHPNNHVNMAQSTNDAYPCGARLGIVFGNERLICEIKNLVESFRKKANEMGNHIKIGRTQLQDAVPMTYYQEFESYAATIESEVKKFSELEKNLYVLNMGATAIGTGINADPAYAKTVVKHLSKVTGLPISTAKNLIAATNDTSDFVSYSGQLKRLALKLTKICNDLRLLSSGPRTGFAEIKLPPRQPGSSIMPGKVNPVIPEAMNQIAFKVIGNDLTVTLGSENGQLELNVFEPVMIYSIFDSVQLLINGMKMLRIECVDGIEGNYEHGRDLVYNSISLVTALNPIIGYEASSSIAKAALEEGRSVYDLVLERKLLDKASLDKLLRPENMTKPHRLKKK
ncbi:MAG: aspartate ammonia-lyase [Spirochaetaceae bacterium]|nr:aspartate ammonia-lyase [Spirochaetaceae bacterium]